MRLLNRTTRSVAPTAAGARLYERIAPMMQEMDAAVAEAVAATGRTAGTLRINTLGMAAKKLIAPRLGRFHRAHPDVVLDIVIDDGLSDIVAGRFDAGIRVGERLEKDMIAVRLTPDVEDDRRGITRLPGASRRAESTRPTCTDMPASTGAFRAAARIHRWEFEKKSKKIEIGGEGPLISNHQDVVVEGALQGLGILYAYDDDRIHDSIAAGRSSAFSPTGRRRVPVSFSTIRIGAIRNRRCGHSSTVCWIGTIERATTNY